MGGKDIVRRRGQEAERQSWKCHWCEITMTPISLDAHALAGDKPPTMVTLDHLFGRQDPRRQELPKPGERRWVAACYACNQRRGREHEKKMGLKRSHPPHALQKRR